MGKLGALAALRARLERVIPYKLSTDEAKQFTRFAQQKYSPLARKLSDREFDLRMKFPELDDNEQAAAKRMIEQLSHEAARYSMLDHAATNIAKARLYGDEELRAQLLRDPNGIPGGIVSYYPPGHWPGDPLGDGSTYIENLGAVGEPGQGRVLLRAAGLENPDNPMILQSLNYPATTDFYEKRGGQRVPLDQQTGSALRSMSLPIFRWNRGDQVREKEGGSVKPQKFQVGGLARYFAKNAPKGMSAMSELGTHSAAPRGALSVVKQKGGNWLTGSVEDALRGLKKYAPPEEIAARKGWLDAPHPDLRQAAELRASIPQIPDVRPEWVRMIEENAARLEGRGNAQRQQWQEDLATFEKQAALNDWITRNLGRYVKNEMATPEDPIRLAVESWPERQAAMLADYDRQIAKVRSDAEKAIPRLRATIPNFDPEFHMTATNAAINEIMKKREMVELQSGLHFDPTLDMFAGRHLEHRANSGMVNPLAKTEIGAGWENVTDGLIRPDSAANWRLKAKPQVLSKIPGIDRIPSSEMIHEISETSSLPERLGFDHLIDELHNALDPTSGLPRHLQLDPKSLNRVSVPQAVERVAQINAWRAAQKAEADALRANNAATSLVREYPENNPLGLRWVELRGDGKDPKSHVKRLGQLVQEAPEISGKNIDVKALEKQVEEELGPWPGKDLKDALKYEGDTMGHCVGGYCDDVLSGRTRIFSLRDAKGEPHVTVEVAPQGVVFSDVAGYIGRERAEQLLNEGVRLSEMIDGIPDFKRPQKIVQIKGKQNRAPNAEYLPFVQDFIRNSPLGSPWSDVGDFHNTGLFNLKKFSETPHWSASGFPLSKDEWKQIATDVAPIEIAQKLRQAHPEDAYISASEFRKALGLGEIK